MDEKGRNIERVSETQELIIEMVKSIDNQELLVKIYSFVKVIFEI